MNEDLVNEGWGCSQVSQVNGEMENRFTGGSDEGARRAVVIASGEPEGKGISAAWGGVGELGRGLLLVVVNGGEGSGVPWRL